MMFSLPKLTVVLAILSGISMLGCGTSPATSDGEVERHHEHDGHDHSPGGHAHIGPHNGQLIELGSSEEYHAELLHDPDKHRVTVYILDGAAKTNVPINQPELVLNMVSDGAPRQYKLVAVTLANELPDMASCFQRDDEELSDALDSEGAKGRISVEISGKQYVGEIEHHHEEHEEGKPHGTT